MANIASITAVTQTTGQTASQASAGSGGGGFDLIMQMLSQDAAATFLANPAAATPNNGAAILPPFISGQAGTQTSATSNSQETGTNADALVLIQAAMASQTQQQQQTGGTASQTPALPDDATSQQSAEQSDGTADAATQSPVQTPQKTEASGDKPAAPQAPATPLSIMQILNAAAASQSAATTATQDTDGDDANSAPDTQGPNTDQNKTATQNSQTTTPAANVLVAAVQSQATPVATGNSKNASVPAVTGGDKAPTERADAAQTVPKEAKATPATGDGKAAADPDSFKNAVKNAAAEQPPLVGTTPKNIAGTAQTSVNSPTAPPASATPPVSAAPQTADSLQAAAPQPAQTAAQLQMAAQQNGSEVVSTADKLGSVIAAKSADGVRHFDIRLDPPDLGRVQVHLSVDDSGKAQAHLVVDKPQTLELLQRDAANLNRTLTDAGLNLPNNGLNFSLRDQQRQNDGGVDKGRGRQLSVTAVVQTDANQTQIPIASMAPHSARLDIHV